MPGPIRATVLILATLIACGCRSLVGSDRDVTLPIIDLVVPESASANAPFTVTLTVVSGGCLRFDRLIATRAPGVVALQARGKDSSGPGIVCTADLRYDPQTYQVAPPFSNPFSVTTVQPDGTLTTRTVRIQ